MYFSYVFLLIPYCPTGTYKEVLCWSCLFKKKDIIKVFINRKVDSLFIYIYTAAIKKNEVHIY